MKIAPVDQRQIDGSALQRLGGVEPAKTSPEYDNAVWSTHYSLLLLTNHHDVLNAQAAGNISCRVK